MCDQIAKVKRIRTAREKTRRGKRDESVCVREAEGGRRIEGNVRGRVMEMEGDTRKNARSCG